MKKNLIIIGAGGHGKVIADIAMKMNNWQSIAFLDDDNVELSIGIDVIGKSTDYIKYKKNSDFIVAIGKNETRKKIHEMLERDGVTLAKLVHPNAVIGEQVKISSGTVIMAGAIINCCTSIGKSCIINTGSTVDHDCVIEDYVHIGPGASLAGTVSIGKGAFMGVGSIAINNVKIVAGCVVGAGAVVINDLKEVATYAGVPAKKIK